MTKARREAVAVPARGIRRPTVYRVTLSYTSAGFGTAFTQSVLFTDDPELTREHAPT